jgi:hypothetical protein
MVGDKTDETPTQDGSREHHVRFVSILNNMEMKKPPVKACV